MSINLSDALQLIVTIIGILVALAAVVAFFRFNLARATIDALKENNQALEARVGILETEKERQAARIEYLLTENEVLKRLATGQEQIAAFQADVLELERQQSREHAEITSVMRDVFEELQRGRAS